MNSFYEGLLQRSNHVQQRVFSEISGMNHEQLNWKENHQKWSIIEVIDHLNCIYDKYLDNFTKAIEAAPEATKESNGMQSTIMGRLSIFSMKPKGKKRRFKMKTFDFFEPKNSLDINETIKEFLDKKERFNTLIKSARLKNLENIKMSTSLEKLRFYVPETFEFVMTHEERHMIQIDEIIDRIK